MRDRLYCPSLLLLAVVSAAGVFAFDYSLPLGVASGMPYVVLVLLGIITRRARDVIFLATLGTLLIIAGYYLSEPGGGHYMVLINRGLVLLAIWSVALVF